MPVTNFPDGVNVGSAFEIGGTAVTATAADLNAVAPIVGGTAVAADGAYVVDFGSTAITGSGTVPTGLDGAVSAVVASLASGIGASAGDPAVVQAAPDGTGGSVAFTVLQDDFTTEATNAGTVAWIAFGTALQ